MRRALFVIVAASCNPVFDLDPTAIAPLDRDGDRIEDRDDNCIDVANPDQSESDGDALGDACDDCAGTLADTNHDEDLDGRPDACDVCPALGDFGYDTDGDGVGDACDYDARISLRTVFEPFESLDAWERTDGWHAIDDTAFPEAQLVAGDVGIRLPRAIDADYFTVSTLIVSREHWPPGARAGVVLQPPGGGPVTSCLVECTGASCTLSLVVEDVLQKQITVQQNPFALMGMSSGLVDPVTGVRDYNCASPGLGPNTYLYARPAAPAAGSWIPHLVATPILRASYVEIVE